MEESDFTIVPIFWNSGLNLDKQFNDLRARIEHVSPECVVILNVPRHHAKKIAQQDWTKDYYVSKQSSKANVTRVCTVVYSKHPYTSEEWISGADSSVTHIAEICIPIGAWKPHHSPIELLQEYGLTYDEVATITVAASNSANVSSLQQIFDVNKLKNTIAFVTNSGVAVDTIRWQHLSSVDDKLNQAIHLKSDITFAGAAVAKSMTSTESEN